MAKIQYKTVDFRRRTLPVIKTANDIIAEYQAQGYTLTLRQLYYQFVARDIIPNTQKEYDKLGVTISNGRLAGLIDWEAIIDRTRTIEGNSHFKDPSDILTTAAEQYKLDTRFDQDIYVEVWIEKEALLGVIERVCRQLDVTYLACRGYYSQTAMWQAAQRIGLAQQDGKKVVILHLGDHDPSGLDMTRDIQVRLCLFAGIDLAGLLKPMGGIFSDLGFGGTFEFNTPRMSEMFAKKFGRKLPVVERIALNINQVRQYNPPPNFAKLSDTRTTHYIAEYGRESWELDALDPKVITSLIEDAIDKNTDQNKRQANLDEQESHKQRLAYIAEHWAEIKE